MSIIITASVATAALALIAIKLLIEFGQWFATTAEADRIELAMRGELSSKVGSWGRVFVRGAGAIISAAAAGYLLGSST